ncbi:hypothetical protein DB346_02515 [Verrucomicrobia bacterium LW23]|nr:hypothetical protein DB346_04140 [Verrucomicrobia bacterium LW23]PTY04322.1 hypothetical protein DB346_02515 [Verrucomicrobia bacterium LW23]
MLGGPGGYQQAKEIYRLEERERMMLRGIIAKKGVADTKGAFHEVLPAERARALVKRIAARRFATPDDLRHETAAWSHHTNARQRAVNWQFKTADARSKLKSIYPQLLGWRSTSTL